MLDAKQLLTVCLLVMAPLFIFAQFEKGTNSIGGSGKVGLNYQTPRIEVDINGDSVVTRRKFRTVSLSTSYFRFVSEKVAVGMGITWARQRNSSPYRDQGFWKEREDFTNSIGIYPSLRYHVPLHERWSFFVENYVGAEANYHRQTVPRNGDVQVSESWRYHLEAGIAPGMLLMISKTWSVEAVVPNALQLGGFIIPGDSGPDSFQINANVLDNFSLGSIKLNVRYYF